MSCRRLSEIHVHFVTEMHCPVLAAAFTAGVRHLNICACHLPYDTRRLLTGQTALPFCLPAPCRQAGAPQLACSCPSALLPSSCRHTYHAKAAQRDAPARLCKAMQAGGRASQTSSTTDLRAGLVANMQVACTRYKTSWTQEAGTCMRLRTC